MKLYLGLDWGEKRIGLALGDDETKIASPFCTVNDLEGVLNVIKEEVVDEVVVGLPLPISNFHPSHSTGQEQFQNFLNDLKSQINIPIHEFDERLSSKAADARVGDKKTKASRDEVAAMIILQDYFDSRSS